jgi:hypothetical protein
VPPLEPPAAARRRIDDPEILRAVPRDVRLARGDARAARARRHDVVRVRARDRAALEARTELRRQDLDVVGQEAVEHDRQPPVTRMTASENTSVRRRCTRRGVATPTVASAPRLEVRVDTTTARGFAAARERGQREQSVAAARGGSMVRRRS